MKNILFLSIFVSCFAFANTSSAQAYVTTEGYSACTTKKYLNDLISYANQKDIGAIQQLIDAGVCLQMAAGIPVYLMDTSWGLVEIRPKGMTDTVWTVQEGIRKK